MSEYHVSLSGNMCFPYWKIIFSCSVSPSLYSRDGFYSSCNQIQMEHFLFLSIWILLYVLKLPCPCHKIMTPHWLTNLGIKTRVDFLQPCQHFISKGKAEAESERARYVHIRRRGCGRWAWPSLSIDFWTTPFFVPKENIKPNMEQRIIHILFELEWYEIQDMSRGLLASSVTQVTEFMSLI